MPPTTGRIYDRNRLEELWATNHSCENREESIYGLLALNFHGALIKPLGGAKLLAADNKSGRVPVGMPFHS